MFVVDMANICRREEEDTEDYQFPLTLKSPKRNLSNSTADHPAGVNGIGHAKADSPTSTNELMTPSTDDLTTKVKGMGIGVIGS